MKRLAVWIVLICLLPACLASSLSPDSGLAEYNELFKELQYTFLNLDFDEALSVCEDIAKLGLKNPPRYTEVINARNYAEGRLEMSKTPPDYSAASKLFSMVLPDFPSGDWSFTGAEPANQLKNYCEGMIICTGALQLDTENQMLISVIKARFEAAGYILDSRVLLNTIDNSNKERIIGADVSADVSKADVTIFDFSGETDGYILEYNTSGMPSATVKEIIEKPLDDGTGFATISGLIPDTYYDLTITPTRKQVKSGAAYNVSFHTVQYGEGSVVKPALSDGVEQTFLIKYLKSKKSSRYLEEIRAGIATPGTWSIVGDTLEADTTVFGNGNYGYIFYTRLFQGKRNYKDIDALVVVRGLAEDNEGGTKVLTCAEKTGVRFSSGFATLAMYVDDMLLSITNELGHLPEVLLFDVYIEDFLVLRREVPVK